MSVFNEIQEGGLNQVLTRRLDIKGDVPSPTVTPEIAPSLVLENDRVEWGWLKGERICGRDATQSAVAGQFSSIQLTNPVGSLVIITIERIQNYTAAVNAISRAQLLDGGLVGWSAITSAVMDTRWAAESTSLQVSRTANVAGPSTFAAFARLNGNNDALTQPIVISPGNSIMIVGTAVNTAIGVGIFWRERTAQYSELG